MVKNTIISDELKDMVTNSVTKNPVVVPLDMSHHKRFNIGGVVIAILPDGCIMSYLPDDFASKHSILWKADVGGVLLRELRKKDVLLYEHVSENFKVLLKKIREDEREDFKNKKLNHVAIGDFEFCIIKVVKITDDMYINNVRNEKYIIDDCVVDDESDENGSVYFIDETKLEETEESTQYSLF